jgi:hypothetical protein
VEAIIDSFFYLLHLASLIILPENQKIPIAKTTNPEIITYFPKLVSVIVYFPEPVSIIVYEPEISPKITRPAEAEKSMTIIIITIDTWVTASRCMFS